ncbi:hypothetical protein IFM89_038352, partial [Coptis chinensis]
NSALCSNFDDKIRSTSLKIQGGGNAGNALTCAARLGLNPRLISKVADDAQGRGILEEFEADGVDTSYFVKVTSVSNSSYSICCFCNSNSWQEQSEYVDVKDEEKIVGEGRASLDGFANSIVPLNGVVDISYFLNRTEYNMATLRTTRRDSSFSVIVVMCIVFIVFFKGCTVVLALNYTNYKRVSSLRLERIQIHLNKINKPAIKTIESPDGDIIDCVRRHKQPALDHPLLRKHRIQKPTRLHLDRHVDAPDVGSGDGHEHAFAYTGTSQEIYGAKATINVWDPKVEVVNEFSLSQIWILCGSYNDSGLNTIEAGWQVCPQLYGDSRPRLFTYWTVMHTKRRAATTLVVLISYNKIAIGAAISPVSSVSSNQYDITIVIWKITQPRLSGGGEVVNSRSNGKHTSTQMGSGHFAQDGFGQSSFFRNLEVVDADNSLSSAQHISTVTANPNCYDIKTFYSDGWGTDFYFGGPGYNPQCQ